MPGYKQYWLHITSNGCTSQLSMVDQPLKYFQSSALTNAVVARRLVHARSPLMSGLLRGIKCSSYLALLVQYY